MPDSLLVNPQTQTRTLAAFDFDHTLIQGDSFWPFLGYVAGWPRTILSLIQALVLFAFDHFKGRQMSNEDKLRTYVKAHLIRHLLSGHSLSSITPALSTLRNWQKWNEPIKQALLEHHAAGHHIIIISGALSLYLPFLTEEIPHHGIICTDVSLENGVITGQMTHGNCVRLRKAELLKEYISQHGPFGESWAYGNYPHDIPMMELLKYRIIVS